MTSTSKVKDFYRILNVPRTATTIEIKNAYRKLALTLHPDRNDGDKKKTDAFKLASEAYDTLSDHKKRSLYDDSLHGRDPRIRVQTRSNTPNYRKVYAPRAPPPGMGINHRYHYNMHYGDGIKQEFMGYNKRSQQRIRQQDDDEYVSPLGRGFRFDENASGNPYSSNRTKQHHQTFHKTRVDEDDYQFEEAHIMGWDRESIQNAKGSMRHKEHIVNRMEQRRQQRRPRRPQTSDDDGTCVIA
mmetsp:Transcript_35142/g.53923  ORF Transcript_35142/g.53923 Transcript_35142/m.53923 type:complete len:242 (-) Transcript_35142:123-848(-)|eukprot:CAMPEP_0118689214 /NCGR_PEP_ID=MMETSP0800-20121206/9361_1 /TAXON_ID=210618 ORGANISM="Striatella unipunctata, Strain CCMP2910" /NCGR_SAMPLE_ID=MMETSP0800 /ASSEMBLY_ACC=CAM_ASM_000638 /LENGTH=241 /DNA_ID=CAMNT_0006586579 /DNA_START=121 /DNA_END=846 /DNA_ORIENTATION=-